MILYHPSKTNLFDSFLLTNKIIITFGVIQIFFQSSPHYFFYISYQGNMDLQERKEMASQIIEVSRDRCYECKTLIDRRKDSPFATCPGCTKKRLFLCHVLKPDSQGFYECKQCSRVGGGIKKYVVVECPKGDCGQIWVMKNFYNGLTNRCPACSSEWIIASCPGCYKFLCFPAKNQSNQRICYEKRRLSCKSCSTNFRYWICKQCAFQVFTPKMSSSKEEHLFVCKRATCPFYNVEKSEDSNWCSRCFHQPTVKIFGCNHKCCGKCLKNHGEKNCPLCSEL